MLTLVLAAYAVISVAAFALYAADKRRAARGQWRVSEATLHLVALLGGWPGAWIAQQTLRHKRRKTAFMIVFWIIVAVHGVAWWWASAQFRS